MDRRLISVLSLEYVQASVRVEKGGASADPTSKVVEMAFVLRGDDDPAAGDWKNAIWETETAGPLSTYLASCLVGPGGTVELPVGRYTVFVRVTDAPEIPVMAAGLLEVC